MVQVAIKPLFGLGLDITIFLSLRNARHLDFYNLIRALAKSNIANGPIYLNCYPNFSVR